MSQRTTKTARTAEAAVDRLEKLYAEATSGLNAALDRYLSTGEPPSARGAPPSAIRCCASSHTTGPAAADPRGAPSPSCSGPASTRRRSRTRVPSAAICSSSSSRWSREYGAEIEVGGQRPGDPLPLRAGARRRARRRRRHRRRARAALPDAAAVRRRRRDRRRPVGVARGRAAPAVAVRRACASTTRCAGSCTTPAATGATCSRGSCSPTITATSTSSCAGACEQLRRGRPLRAAGAAGRRRRSSAATRREQAEAAIAASPWHRYQMPAYHLIAPDGAGRDAGQHRRRPVQRQEHHRPPGRAAARTAG